MKVNKGQEEEKIVNNILKETQQVNGKANEESVVEDKFSSRKLLGLVKQYVDLEYSARTLTDREKVEKLLTAFIAIGQVANCEKKE